MRIVSPTGKRLYFNGKNIVSDAQPGPGPEPYPTSIIIDGDEYGVVKIGNQLWTNENLKYVTTDSVTKNIKYGRYYSINDIRNTIPNKLAAEGLTGWHIPTINEMNTMVSFVKIDNNDTNPSNYLYKTSEYSYSTDKYGFSLIYNGFYRKGNYYDMYTTVLGEQTPTTSVANRITFNTAGVIVNGDCDSGWGNIKMCIRLVYNLEI